MAGVDQFLGKYQLKSQLGHGGMGVVYLATDTRLKREVALKILPRQMAADKEAVGRFFQEARVVARLNHPNVVIVHDVDQERGYCYLVMELLTGGTMQQLLKVGPLPWTEATSVIAQACRGLAAAQDAGLIHRDIKPSNIMIAANGIVKLTDFGLAKVVDGIEGAGSNPMTKSGTILGTPHFMSPEQCRGEPLDGRSDLYALGATYFALLVGQPPFVDGQQLQVMFAHCSRPTPNPCSLKADIPAACAQIVMKAMSKNRAERFASAREMLAALDQALVGAPTLPLAPTLQVKAAPNAGADLAPTVKYGSLAVARLAQADAPRHGLPRPRFGRRGIALAAAGGSLAFLLMIVVAARNSFTKAEVPRVAPEPISLVLRAELPVPNAAIRSVAFAKDHKSIIAGTFDGNVQEWDIAQGKAGRKFAGTKQGILALAASPRWLAAGGHAKTVWLWKLDSEQPLAALSEHAGEISALAFSPDGRRLAVGTYSEVKLYDVDDKGATLLKVLGTSTTEPLCYMVMCVAFSPDSRRLAATTWTNKRVHVWDVDKYALQHTSPDLGDSPMAVAFVPGQNKLAIGLQGKGVVHWEMGQGELSRDNRAKPSRALVVTPNGQTAIVVGEWGGNIRLDDLHADAPARTISRATATSAVALALSSDGKLLATGGGDDSAGHGYLHLFDVVRKKAE